MTRRFYVAPEIISSEAVTLEGALAQRITSVLRLKAGDTIALFDGSGEDALVRLESVTTRSVTASVESRQRGPRESRTRVHLYQSITKGERFEWLVEKATEVGVASVTPLLAARAVVKTAAGGNRMERWRRIAVEASEQCGRSLVPAIGAPLALDEALATAPGVLLLPYEEAGQSAPSISAALSDRIDDVFADEAISVFIGPEGGYEAVEVDRARAAGASVVTLGDRVLRSETAGLAALTLVMQAIGEMG